MYDVFSIPDFSFPEDFLWGCATAGHQIEGNNIHSGHWASELERPVDPTGIRKPSGMACNHYNMIDEDIGIIQTLAMQAYRMSVEWSRIEPSDNEFCKEAIDHYLDELSKLKEKGIKIFLTMNHFTCPKWFVDMGGMEDEKNLKYFERFLDRVVPLFAPYVDAWNVLNEFNLGFNIKRKFSFMKFHKIGYYTIKKYSDAPVSSAHAMVMFDPARRYDRFDAACADYCDVSCNEFFFHAMRTGEVIVPPYGGYYDPEMKGTSDFWSINIYTRSLVDSRKNWFNGEEYIHKKIDMIPMDFYLNNMFPETLIHQLTRLTDKPVYITENGCSCDDDDWRIVFITLYLCALKEAMDRGVDVRGYLYWSLLDNYEWDSFVPKFGLVDVNFETFERKIKPSGYFYRDIIKNGGFTQEILRKYLKALPILGK